jgi:hypothetical protein
MRSKDTNNAELLPRNILRKPMRLNASYVSSVERPKRNLGECNSKYLLAILLEFGLHQPETQPTEKINKGFLLQIRSGLSTRTTPL